MNKFQIKEESLIDEKFETCRDISNYLLEKVMKRLRNAKQCDITNYIEKTSLETMIHFKSPQKHAPQFISHVTCDKFEMSHHSVCLSNYSQFFMSQLFF